MSTPTYVPQLTASSPAKLAGTLLVEIGHIPERDCPRAEIWSVSIPGAIPQRLLAAENTSYHSPRWSHDGGHFAFVAEQVQKHTVQIGITDPQGKSFTWPGQEFPFGSAPGGLCTGLTLASWSSSDLWVAFDQTNFDGRFFRHLIVTDTETGEATLVEKNSFGFPPPAWAPKEDVLAYVSFASDAAGHRVRQINLRVAELQVGDGVAIKDLGVPAGFEIDSRSDRIRGLLWQATNRLLVAVTPTIGDGPATLYQVNTTTGIWAPVAQYAQNPQADTYPPSQISLSPDGQFVAWIGTDLLILETTTWKEVGRIQTTWLHHPIVVWVTSSTESQQLAYNDANSIWLYDVQSKEPDLLIPDTLFPEGEGFVLRESSWRPQK